MEILQPSKPIKRLQCKHKDTKDPTNKNKSLSNSLTKNKNHKKKQLNMTLANIKENKDKKSNLHSKI
jgi:hypothetical protein